MQDLTFCPECGEPRNACVGGARYRCQACGRRTTIYLGHLTAQMLDAPPSERPDSAEDRWGR